MAVKWRPTPHHNRERSSPVKSQDSSEDEQKHIYILQSGGDWRKRNGTACICGVVLVERTTTGDDWLFNDCQPRSRSRSYARQRYSSHMAALQQDVYSMRQLCVHVLCITALQQYHHTGINPASYIRRHDPCTGPLPSTGQRCPAMLADYSDVIISVLAQSSTAQLNLSYARRVRRCGASLCLLTRMSESVTAGHRLVMHAGTYWWTLIMNQQCFSAWFCSSS